MVDIVHDRKSFHEKTKEIPNLLIGNGFGLSHPILSEAFKWNREKALVTSWEDILTSIKSPATTTGPETDLYYIRIAVVKKIIKFYMDSLFELMRNENGQKKFNCLYDSYKKAMTVYNCNQFLSGRKNVFTLNYDPIMYFEILSRKNEYFDGFVCKNDSGRFDDCLSKHYEGKQGDREFSKQEYISCKLMNCNTKTRILYMHGSWFIQANEEHELKKLRFGSSEYTIDSLFEDDKRPYIVLEDRWRVKRNLMDPKYNPYFGYCYQQLKETTGELLVFGCSFDKDDHILEALNKASDVNLTTCYITHVNDADKENLKDKLNKEYPSLSKKVFPLKIGTNVIWENTT